MIEVPVSPTADTRTCDWANVSRETLLSSSEQHIRDVYAAMNFFANMIYGAANRHDFDKIDSINWFHGDFVTGFKQTGWWDNHRRIHRHHLAQQDGVPEDVNLIDILEYISDCVMAGAARTGSVEGIYGLQMTPELLEKAFKNTCELLKANIKVIK